MSGLAASTALLGLAWFAAICVVSSAAAWVLARLVLVSPYRERGGVLLAVRLLPSIGSAVFVSAIFVPGHWTLEPDRSEEAFGVAVYALAFLGAALVSVALQRAAAVVRAGRLLLGRVPPVVGVSLAGILRTRILISQEVRASLTADELDAAIAHELAHRDAADNLKRFLMACAPDLLGGSRTARQLEERWHAAAEAAADAKAVAGDERRALSLASALVKVAKLDLELPSAGEAAAWSLLHDPPLLEARVRRLVAARPPACAAPSFARSVAAAVVGTAGLAGAATVLAGPIHQVTETLVRWLP